MRQLLFIVFLLSNLTLFSQKKEKTNLFKSLYKDFIKYGTIYGAADVSNSIEANENVFFVITGDGDGLYDIPIVVDDTPKYPFDYRVGFGIRKLARFSYERKPKNFYDGAEKAN